MDAGNIDWVQLSEIKGVARFPRLPSAQNLNFCTLIIQRFSMHAHQNYLHPYDYNILRVGGLPIRKCKAANLIFGAFLPHSRIVYLAVSRKIQGCAILKFEVSSGGARAISPTALWQLAMRPHKCNRSTDRPHCTLHSSARGCIPKRRSGNEEYSAPMAISFGEPAELIGWSRGYTFVLALLLHVITYVVQSIMCSSKMDIRALCLT